MKVIELENEGNMKTDKTTDPSNKIKITPKEESFIVAYFEENQNATRAYMKCYPAAQYNGARASASQLLAKPNIRAEITKRLSEKAISVDEALARLGDMARATHLPFIKIDNDGFVYFDFSQPGASEHMYLIKKIKTKRERRLDSDKKEWEGEWVEVELHDSLSAIRDALRIHGKFVDQTRDLSQIDDFIINNIGLFTDGQIQRMQGGEDKSKVLAELLQGTIEGRNENLPKSSKSKKQKNIK